MRDKMREKKSRKSHYRIFKEFICKLWWEIKELLKDTRKKTVDLHQAGKSESTIGKQVGGSNYKKMEDIHDH